MGLGHLVVSLGCATCRINKQWKQLTRCGMRKKSNRCENHHRQSIIHKSCKQKSHGATNIPCCNQVSGGSFWFAFTFTFASREELVELQVETGWGAKFVRDLGSSWNGLNRKCARHYNWCSINSNLAFWKNIWEYKTHLNRCSLHYVWPNRHVGILTLTYGDCHAWTPSRPFPFPFFSWS